MEGFCIVEVNASGPLQWYVAPGIGAAWSWMLSPVQTGLLLEAAGGGGASVILTFSVVALEQLPTVAVML